MADRAGHQGCHPKQVEPQTTFQLRQEILQTATPHRECLLPAQRFPAHRHPLRQARQKFPRLRLPRRCRCMVDFMSRDPRLLDDMARGRKTGGRKKGSRNRATAEARAAAEATGVLPLDYMLLVMRDANADVKRRDAMAMAAAPYLHAKISTIDAKLGGASEKPDEVSVTVRFV